VFPEVEAVDLVATNVAWMAHSNDLVRQEYPGTPLCSSDAHSWGAWERNEIGRSGCGFPELDFSTAQEFRSTLRKVLSQGDFKTHLRYLGPLKFLRSIAFSKPSDEHP
jgi:hypothetical protein